jgi:mannose-6-phosphate isomerase-like protein (cupin superfamily)
VQEGVYVPAGGDRFREHREVFGTRRIDYKVSTPDMNGGLFISEIVDDHKGGPSRHLHYEQDEWFYVIEGEYSIEVGDERFHLGQGIASSRQEWCRTFGLTLEKAQAS